MGQSFTSQGRTPDTNSARLCGRVTARMARFGQVFACTLSALSGSPVTILHRTVSAREACPDGVKRTRGASQRNLVERHRQPMRVLNIAGGAEGLSSSRRVNVDVQSSSRSCLRRLGLARGERLGSPQRSGDVAGEHDTYERRRDEPGAVRGSVQKPPGRSIIVATALKVVSEHEDEPATLWHARLAPSIRAAQDVHKPVQAVQAANFFLSDKLKLRRMGAGVVRTRSWTRS